MFKSYKYRIYPTKAQASLLVKHIGAVRFVYNLALETKQTAWTGGGVTLSRYDLQQQLRDLKKDVTWLKDINSQSLQVALLNLDNAYFRFFKGLAKFPRFKTKNHGKHSFSIPQNVYIKNSKLLIPKFQEGIPIVEHIQPDGNIKQATVSKTPTGKFYVSILFDLQMPSVDPPPIDRGVVGIDLGIKEFAITSTGVKYKNPQHLKQLLSKIQFYHRKFSKYKGERTKHKLALLHEKVANQRKDFLHKLSSELIKNHDSIAIETLLVENMVKNRRLSRAISDTGWGAFADMLEYKAEWYGKNIIKIGAFQPSSKTCSNCGHKKEELKLSERTFNCASCGFSLDRDLNAAINIKNIALKMVSGVDTKIQDELPPIGGVMTSEARTEQLTDFLLKFDNSLENA